MKFKIYIIGKIKDKNHLNAIEEYKKRLSRYCKIELIELKNVETLLKKISNETYIILINPNGTQLSSEEFAKKINTLGVKGNSDVAIILSEEAIKSNEHLCISNMKLNIGLEAVVIFEQIYRGYRILRNEPYHK